MDTGRYRFRPFCTESSSTLSFTLPGTQPSIVAAYPASFEIADDVCTHNKYSGHTCNRTTEPFVWSNLVRQVFPFFVFFFHFPRFAHALEVGTNMNNPQLNLPINSLIRLVIVFFSPFCFSLLFFSLSFFLCLHNRYRMVDISIAHEEVSLYIARATKLLFSHCRDIG